MHLQFFRYPTLWFHFLFFLSLFTSFPQGWSASRGCQGSGAAYPQCCCGEQIQRCIILLLDALHAVSGYSTRCVCLCVCVCEVKLTRHHSPVGFFFLSKSLHSAQNELCVFVSTDNEEKREEMLKKFHSFQHLAELYHVYHSIHRYMVILLIQTTSSSLLLLLFFLLAVRHSLTVVNEFYKTVKTVIFSLHE